MNTKKVWLVTGASKGLGLSLVQQLLAAGYMVAATSRNPDVLRNEVGGNDSDSRFIALDVDLMDEQSIARAVSNTLRAFGRIDVVVNNAGYGQLGTLEELSDAEARQNFDVNVFGSLNMIRAIMPHMRERKSGAIFNIASIGGFIGNFPGWGIYCATKFAVAGFTEALAAEAKEFGITATVVYPGYFRTNFLSKGSLTLPLKPIKEYTLARNMEAAHEEQINGSQPGDPKKAAEVFIEVLEGNAVPVHLFLGKDAYELVDRKIEMIRADTAAYVGLATATDFQAS